MSFSLPMPSSEKKNFGKRRIRRAADWRHAVDSSSYFSSFLVGSPLCSFFFVCVCVYFRVFSYHINNILLSFAFLSCKIFNCARSNLL